MRYLTGAEEQEALGYLAEAAKVALEATCQRDRCGTVIVQAGEIIGRGYNSPPANKESQRRCMCDKTQYHAKVTDKMCCVHAEQRAIMDALQHNSDKIRGSRLYFIRLDAEGNSTRSGNPYCTICSKMSLDSGVGEFVLRHEQGVGVYDTEEYNRLSYEYQG